MKVARQNRTVTSLMMSRDPMTSRLGFCAHAPTSNTCVYWCNWACIDDPYSVDGPHPAGDQYLVILTCDYLSSCSAALINAVMAT